MFRCFLIGLALGFAPAALAQSVPAPAEIASLDALHQAAQEGDVARILGLAEQGVDLDARDGAGRTAAHVAAFASQDEALQALAEAGADMNALEHQA